MKRWFQLWIDEMRRLKIATAGFLETLMILILIVLKDICIWES